MLRSFRPTLVTVCAGFLMVGAAVLPTSASAESEPTDDASGESSVERHELVAQRTETNRTFQNSDGTLTTEMASQPVRFKESGEWRTIDTTLVERAGVWVPKASPVRVEFSDGGVAAFATLDRAAGDSIALGWPTHLPEPRVEGNTLTYADVVPNGDLVVTALPAGFTHSLVLNSKPSDTSMKIPLPVRLDGTTLAERADGGLQVTSSDDAPIKAPEPLMWDSSVGAFGLPQNIEPVDAAVQSSGGQTTLTLTPDEGMLSDPDTVYPVTIDPTFTQEDTPTSETFVVSGGSYTNSSTNKSLDFFDTGYSNGLVARSFLKFPNFDYTNKQITAAELQARNIQSPGCTNGSTIPQRITVAWSESTLRWDNQPASVDDGTPPQYWLPHGGPASTPCAAHGWGKWNVTSTVQQWAEGAGDFRFQAPRRDRELQRQLAPVALP